VFSSRKYPLSDVAAYFEAFNFPSRVEGENVGLTLNSTESRGSYRKQNMGVAPG